MEGQSLDAEGLWCCPSSALHLQSQHRPKRMLTLGWRAQQMRQQVGQAAPASSQRIDASISNTYTWPSLSHLCRALLLVISMVRQSLGGIQPSITRKLDLSAGQACTKHLFLNELHPTLDTIHDCSRLLSSFLACLSF